MTLTILDDGSVLSLSEDMASLSASGRIEISKAALGDLWGWEIKAEGLCRVEGDDDICIPVRNLEALTQGEGVDLAAFADAVGRPIVIDHPERIAALGTAASSRAAGMTSLRAPDFELPDLAGRMHRLSEHRDKKVLLIAYASW